MQSLRSLVAFAEWAQKTTFEPSRVTFAWSVEFSGQVVGWFQRNVPDERATCDRRKQESCFREFILFGETVMPSKKPNDKGKVFNCASIVLDLVDRSTSCERTVGREETKRTSVV